MINAARFKTVPFQHQLEDTKRLVDQALLANFSEMGTGKSKTVIDAACLLYERQQIDTLLLVCPAQVKGSWLDPDLGQLATHAWQPLRAHHWYGGQPQLELADGGFWLTAIVVSYEYLREQTGRDFPKVEYLATALRGRQVLVAFDESIRIKNVKAAQTKACFRVKELATRRVLLNGTPIANSGLDLYCQFACLDKSILGYENYYAFRNRHALMGGWMNKQVVGFRDMEQVTRRTAPYVVRRMKKDCLDLPEKLYTTVEVPLRPETWKIYKEMRDDLVAWLGSASATATNAAVKGMRLSQILSGFAGGIVDDQGETLAVQEIGSEKTDALLDWIEERINPEFRVFIWARFRAEIARLTALARRRWPGLKVMELVGGQPRAERARVEEEGKIGTGACLAVGQPQAGGLGIDLVTWSLVPYLSRDHSLVTRDQSEDRHHRPGQRNPVTYVDFIATGPEGQRTFDHTTVKAVRKKQDISRWTTDQWRQALAEEGW